MPRLRSTSVKLKTIYQAGWTGEKARCREKTPTYSGKPVGVWSETEAPEEAKLGGWRDDVKMKMVHQQQGLVVETHPVRAKIGGFRNIELNLCTYIYFVYLPDWQAPTWTVGELSMSPQHAKTSVFYESYFRGLE